MALEEPLGGLEHRLAEVAEADEVAGLRDEAWIAILREKKALQHMRSKRYQEEMILPVSMAISLFLLL